MANPSRPILAILAIPIIALAVAACSGGAAIAPTAAPAKPAATSAPAAPPAPATTSAPAAAPTKPASTSGGDIVIGAAENATGLNSSQGELYSNAAKLAVKQINAVGGINGKQIKLAIEDMQSTNSGGLAATQKAIEQDKALVMIVGGPSTQVQAVSDTLKAAGIPTAMGGTAITLTNVGNPWLFRLQPDDSISAAAMVQYIKDDLKLTKVGILHDSDVFGSGGATLVEQSGKEQGLTVVKNVGYTAGNKDFTAQLLLLKDAGAEVMVDYTPSPVDAALIQRQYHSLNPSYKYIGSSANGEADTLALSKDAAAGIYVVNAFYPGQTPESKAYMDAYQKEYGTPADALTTWIYDAIEINAKAIAAVGEDRQKIMQYILGIHGNYTGAVGTFDFTPNGDGLHSQAIIQVQSDDSLKMVKVVTAPARKQ